MNSDEEENEVASKDHASLILEALGEEDGHSLSGFWKSRSRTLIQDAVNRMSLGLTVTDLRGKIVYINSAEAEMHGFVPTELIGESASVFAPQGAQSTPPAPGESVWDSTWTRERLSRRRDGSEFPVRLTSSVVKDAEGAPIGKVTTCEDLSSLIKVHDTIARVDRILSAVGYASERFLTGKDWQDEVNSVLERLVQATGVERSYVAVQESAGVAFPGWTGSSLGAAAAVGLSGVIRGWLVRTDSGELLVGKTEDMSSLESRVLSHRGVSAFVVVPLRPTSSAAGVLVLEESGPRRAWTKAELDALLTAGRILVAAMERSEGRRELEESQHRLQSFLNDAPDLIVSIAPDGRFLWANREAQRLLEYGAEEFLCLRLQDVVDPEYFENGIECLKRGFEGGPVETIDTVFVSKTGTRIRVEGRVSPTRVDGLPVAVQGMFRDISNRLEVDRMKQRFLSIVSHELRTPLTSIIASLALLRSGRVSPTSERSLPLVDVAHRNGERLLQLVNDLLDLQRLSVGKMTFYPEDLECSPFLEGVLKEMSVFAETRGVTLILESRPNLIVRADKGRLFQVLSNLLSNASKYSPLNGSVLVDVEYVAGRIEISVTDKGPGIPKKMLARVFEEFAQVEDSVSRRSAGSGLGLSIVKALVEGMQGSIRLASEVGVGTKAIVVLPGYEQRDL